MRNLGYAPKARVIVLERRPADANTAEQLQLAPGSPVYYGHRLRSIGEEPVVLEQFALPADRFAGLDGHDLTTRSLYEVMETEYSASISFAHQALEAVIATPYEADLLGVVPGAPLMLEQRVTFDNQRLPIEYGKDLYRGDRFRFVTELAHVDEARAGPVTAP